MEIDDARNKRPWTHPRRSAALGGAGRDGGPGVVRDPRRGCRPVGRAGTRRGPYDPRPPFEPDRCAGTVLDRVRSRRMAAPGDPPRLPDAAADGPGRGERPRARAAVRGTACGRGLDHRGGDPGRPGRAGDPARPGSRGDRDRKLRPGRPGAAPVHPLDDLVLGLGRRFQLLVLQPARHPADPDQHDPRRRAAQRPGRARPVLQQLPRFHQHRRQHPDPARRRHFVGRLALVRRIGELRQRAVRPTRRAATCGWSWAPTTPGGLRSAGKPASWPAAFMPRDGSRTPTPTATANTRAASTERCS